MKMCAKCGGSMKKGGATKKMAKGGVQKIVGMPGYNATLYPTSFKKGGAKKTLIKAQLGIPVPKTPDIPILSEPFTPSDPKKEYSDARKRAKLEARFDKRDERQEARQTARDLALSKRMEKNEVKSAKKEIRKGIRREKRLTSNSLFKKGGATSFGMLSVKAGVDKNPKATAADRIAGAKMKKKMGGSTKKK